MELPPGQYFGKKWIIYAALGIPRVDIKNYKLKVDGLVENPLELLFDELVNLGTEKYTADFNCVTKWTIKGVEWEGVKIKKLAEMAKVKPDADWVMFSCLDGYTAPVPMVDALDDRALVAVKMNGKPIELSQGYPARPFIPHLYGWKSAKWLNEITFMKGYEDGYWEMYGYHERANVYNEERFKGDNGKHSKRRVFGFLDI
jgi:DMSO/TMAO reductase YedYZ molybdopterin-dependent catalytic subunit